MKFDPQQISIKQALLLIVGAALLGGPAGYQVIYHVGFGPCVTAFQDHLFGGHFMKFSVMMVGLLDMLCVLIPIGIVGILVRCITGRALLQLLRKENKPIDESAARISAKASCACAIFIIVLLSFAHRDGALRAVGEISMLLMAPGLLLGMNALFGIRHYGPKGILAPALTGIAINGTLLFIFATSFFAARSTAHANTSLQPEVEGFGTVVRTPSAANTHQTYKSKNLNFDYDGAYELKRNDQSGQVLLQHPDSYVVICCVPKNADMVTTLKHQLSVMQEILRKESDTGFTQTEAQYIEGTIRSGNLIRMEWDAAESGRLHGDGYILSDATHYILVTHIYEEEVKANGGKLFAPVLHSLMDGSGTIPVSSNPAPIQAAVPAPTPKGPPVLANIMWVSTKPSAQLDKNWAFEGDHVCGYKVTKINHDSVDLLTPEGAPLKLVLAAQVAGK